MARPNRVSLPDSTYYVSAQIVNGEKWFAGPGFKEEVVGWMRGVAAFSGVELLSWCVLDNRLELVVHVPKVPERYWTNPDSPPASHAYGMRPVECRPPLWEAADADGDRPHRPARPGLGFMLPESELFDRLADLYGDGKRVEKIRKLWRTWRETGRGEEVEEAKARLCRRMYNLSQFMKTLTERLASAVKARTGQTGPVFGGRFHSGLIQDDDVALRLAVLYVDHAPYREGLSSRAGGYCWSSLGEAFCGDGPHGSVCRSMYARIWKCPWETAKDRIQAAFSEKNPDGKTADGKTADDATAQTLASMSPRTFTPGQVVKRAVPELARGGFIGRDVDFVRRATTPLPVGFPRPGIRSLRRLVKMVAWSCAA